MKVAIIGRSEKLYDTAFLLREVGHEIVGILTAKEAPEYNRKIKDFRSLAESWDIPFTHGPKIGQFANFLRDVNADIGVSINYPSVVPQSIIDFFPLGILNAHGGDLPRYRGNACQAWAILCGEERIGLCIHKMVGGELDSGDIIARDFFIINDSTKITDCHKWMGGRVPSLFVEAIERLNKDPNYILERQSVNPEYALRCYPRKPEDGQIDWEQSNLSILRLINATNKPYDGAFCELEGEKVVIWDAEIVDDKEVFCSISGQVTLVGDSFVEVACKQGKLRIKKIEIRGETGPPNRWIKSIRKRFE